MAFCSKFSTTNITGITSNFHVPNTDYHVEVYQHVQDFRHLWQPMEDKFSIFFHCDYLEAIQKANIEGLVCQFILIYKQNRIVGFMPIQIKDFDARKNILDLSHQNGFNLRNRISKFVKFHSVVLGNIFVSGPYMHACLEDLDYDEKFKLTELILNHFHSKFSQTTNNRINFTLVKDIPAPELPSLELIDKKNYKSFTVEPVMQFQVKDYWQNMEDYTRSMTSKYRVRYRRAIKKFNGLEFQKLNVGDLERLKDKMFLLYKNILDNVNFTLFTLSKDYFISLKKFLANNFLVVGAFKDSELVGFCSAIRNGEELHVHFLGYDHKINREHQLYLNMLYLMIEKAIDFKFKTIDFGRTALEIKSSVGAVPVEMFDFIKHKNNLANVFLPPLIKILHNETEWVPRHPFKKEKASLEPLEN